MIYIFLYLIVGVGVLYGFHRAEPILIEMARQ